MITPSTVYLVGAGPGDPDLLTLKAHRLLQETDAVVYDRLVSEQVLELIPTGVTRIAAGKAPGHHRMNQGEINRLLVKLARAGHTVVRLKGGDPFIFGRGSEEARYLVQHGVPFEVVPGVTAAAACSAYAGIPLTHRGLARGVRIVTGHCRGDEPLELEWDKLTDPEATLVVYMGVAHVEQICSRLEQAGLDPNTPAAAVANGTTRQQRRCLATLRSLPERLRSEQLQSPVTIIVGRVVDLAGELDWFEPDSRARSQEEGQGGLHA